MTWAIRLVPKPVEAPGTTAPNDAGTAPTAPSPKPFRASQATEHGCVVDRAGLPPGPARFLLCASVRVCALSGAVRAVGGRAAQAPGCRAGDAPCGGPVRGRGGRREGLDPRRPGDRAERRTGLPG